ncbi:MAG: TorD/DmsD family molecular chaperone [Dissulfurimicrobium sp.]|uniref:TorD/DmsD family molecular chaperone n=1 Tax=Dissulfurimicrobium sp. TaxID=2022436 RepID=UPI00404A9549
MEAAFIFHCLSEAFSFPDKPPSANDGVVKLLAQFQADVKSKKTTINPVVNSVDAENLSELQAEYTRLFINAPRNVPAPPYASVYLSGNRRLMQEGYDEAIRFYLEAGLEPIKGPEPADHIFYELEFIAMLLETGQTALLCRFLKEHILKWYPQFLEHILQADPISYYEALAKITMSSLINLEKELCHEGESILKNGGSL